MTVATGKESQTPPEPRAASREIEWPTWFIILLVHGLWLGLVAGYDILGPWVTALLLVPVITLHSSMCHEILHGHPTRVQWLNDLFGQLPLSLMVPYFTFKESHLKHHLNDQVTLPGVDPESYFVCPKEWGRLGYLNRTLAWLNMTFAGRFILDPALKFIEMLGDVLLALSTKKWQRFGRYAAHFILAGLVVYIVHGVFAIPLWQYLLIAYLSQSLLRLRSYFEHRPNREVKERTVIVESCRPFQLLFLNNNFHATHHKYPAMPWYRIKQDFSQNRFQYLADNGNFYYAGYLQWIKLSFRPVASPIHPFSIR